MRFISLLIGKTILRSLRILGRSGSALPGLVIEKINPKFLSTMLAELPKGVIVVTGTNGKTTTTKVLSSLLEGQGLRVLTNKTGSNFVRGTVTTVIDKASLSGRLPYDVAVYELDEAHAVHFVKKVKPAGVIALNIMRDQMDRFGEIDTTAKMVQEVVGSAKNWVVLNGNDQRVSKLQPGQNVKKYFFGHSKELQSSYLTDDEMHHQGDITYFLGGTLDYELTSYAEDVITLRHNDQQVEYPTELSSSHNAINLTAALTAVDAQLKVVDTAKLLVSVQELRPAFGRGENFMLTDGTNITLQLVKNPGGFTHSLRMLSLAKYDVVAIAINDDYADGRDVSWLWDVDFSMLKNVKPIICGGTRGLDMAVRLKYDDAYAEDNRIDLGAFVAAVNTQASTRKAIIFCTYTAMLKIRALYQKQSNEVYGVEV